MRSLFLHVQKYGGEMVTLIFSLLNQVGTVTVSAIALFGTHGTYG